MSQRTAGPVLVLVGPPGSGKTTVGDELARRLDLPVRDTDDDIVRSQGRSVSDIFVTDGEPVFRALEEAAVAQALAEHRGVLALGGGAVLSERTRGLLQGHRVVFLDVNLSAAAARVGMNSGRPLLLGNVRGRMKQLLDERRPIYSTVATWRVDTNGLTPEEVADQVLQILEEDESS